MAFIAESPTRDETATGLPLCGRAGELLEAYLGKFSVKRSEVWVDQAVMCLSGPTAVRTPTGPQRIDMLVKAKSRGPVLALNTRGTFEWVPIQDWHRSLRAERPLFKISSRFAKTARVGIVGPVVTGDHLIKTLHGWRRADEVHGDLIATGYSALVGVDDVIVGTLLGDASLSQRNLTFGHTGKNLDYLQLKATVLNLPRLRGIGESATISHLSAKAGVGYGRKFVTKAHAHFHSFASPWFEEMRARWYPEGGKVVPMDWVETHLTPRALAVWFMDDGHMGFKPGGRLSRAEIATNSFTYAEVQQLCALLQVKFKLMSKPQFNRGWRISFGVQAARQLSKIIAPFAPPSMQYKLVPCDRGQFDAAHFTPAQVVPYYDVAIVMPVAPRRQDKWVYCLSVGPLQNFVTSNAVVHNCFPAGGDLKTFLQRSNKETKAAGGTVYNPVTCCRPRLMRALKTPVCGGCSKFVGGANACSCEFPKPITVKGVGKAPKVIVPLGNVAMDAVLGVTGITARRGYVFDLRARREERAEKTVKGKK